MRTFLRAIGGGIAIMISAALVGIGVNAIRPDSIRLIQSVVPVATATHGHTAADRDEQAPLPEGAVGIDEMKGIVDERIDIVLDARSPKAFADGHIPGAVNIPYDELPAYMETLQIEAPMDARVICYCWSPTCDFADQLATELRLLGYEDVAVFTGGWEQWTAAGYATAKESGN